MLCRYPPIRKLSMSHKKVNGENIAPLTRVLYRFDRFPEYVGTSLVCAFQNRCPSKRIKGTSTRRSDPSYSMGLSASALRSLYCCIFFMACSSRWLASDSELVFRWGRTSSGKKNTHLERLRLNARLRVPVYYLSMATLPCYFANVCNASKTSNSIVASAATTSSREAALFCASAIDDLTAAASNWSGLNASIAEIVNLLPGWTVAMPPLTKYCSVSPLLEITSKRPGLNCSTIGMWLAKIPKSPLIEGKLTCCTSDSE